MRKDDHIEKVCEWKESGKSAKVWCKENGISYGTFLRWKNAYVKNNAKVEFEEIRVQKTEEHTENKNGQIHILIIRNGQLIELVCPTERKSIREALEAVIDVCC